jgi:uncharacterized Ntn-hydrolase superfamily protein
VTFSIVARDPQKGSLGIAISTARPCVGAGTVYVQQGVGAIASQAWTNPRLGTHGLRLLEVGLSPEAALTVLLEDDSHAARRQVGAVDTWGRVFTYSGAECEGWFGHRTGDNYSVQGNMLVSEDTIGAMSEAFEATSGHLAERLLAALEAGQAAGGDKRGRVSAALAVRPPLNVPLPLWESVDIRVDEHPDPVAELRRIFDIVQQSAHEMQAELERLREAEGK